MTYVAFSNLVNLLFLSFSMQMRIGIKKYLSPRNVCIANIGIINKKHFNHSKWSLCLSFHHCCFKINAATVRDNVRTQK